jgi:hypothetical protein
MRKHYFNLILLTLSISAFGQCPFDNTFYVDLTPVSQGATVSESCVWGGDLVTSNVVAGETYIISLCANAGFEDSQLTLYNSAGTTVLGYDDDYCGYYSQITWVASYTGVLNILIDEYNCIDGTSCMNLDVTWQAPLSAESFEAQKIVFYPNPVKDIITFDILMEENHEVLIYDINGRLLLSKEISDNNNTVNVGHLISGIYQMEIKSDTKTFTKKIIKN